MLEQYTINHIREELIYEFSGAHIPSRITLGYGNIFQTVEIMPVSHESNQYIELRYGGALRFDDWGGGNYKADWALDVGIFCACEADMPTSQTQTAQDITYIMSVCSKTIHLFDDFGYITPTTAEPVEQIFNGEMVLIDYNGHTYAKVVQRYRISERIYHYDELKGGDVGLNTGTGDLGTI